MAANAILYTPDRIMEALKAKTATRVLAFRYDLLDSTEKFKKALYCVEDSSSIAYNALADIKRTASFSLKKDDDIDFVSDRIQAFVRLRMPDKNFVEWPVGIFLLSSPEQQDRNDEIFYKVEAYDGLQVLIDDKFEDRYTIASGTAYTIAIKTILSGAGITKVNIENSTLTLSTYKEFDPGTTKLAAINWLLSKINFISLYVDVNGYYTSRKYIAPANRSIDITYADDELSILCNSLVYKMDLFNVPNKFVRYTSNAETTSLRSVYTNTNADSPLSTVSRGRTILDIQSVDDIANQTTLDEYTERIASEASQVYGYITCETAIVPMHEHGNIVRIESSLHSIFENFTETGWSYQLKAGARMKHSLRRLISV